ncbi:hypothetical protein BgAZ_208390 [Babesia gibsoni]|uniref:EF-hand domain-containing protein n=1 Tax=Babesia gibsoni TaxID=33632 RepID=A0AAD8PEM9_BABGI|nr:hypothetical protein BgAZ_208390 [Babesia gibsoni]
MSARGRKEGASAAKTIYYHSAIGTHRLQPRPLKNILYPYYRHYKPVYRARNPRTPNYYWPPIDKYPWHSHQKRFPRVDDISISLFSEFCNRSPAVKTLFEALHPLPLHGVNCLFWKTPKGEWRPNAKGHLEDKDEDGAVSREDIDQRILKISDSYYLVDMHVRNDACYLIKHVDFRLRPFKAVVVSDLYVGGKLIRENVSPIGSVRGEWRWSIPYRISSTQEVDKVTSDVLCAQNSALYAPAFVEYRNTNETH